MAPITQISRCRLWLMRLFVMIFVPALVLGGIELGLRLVGYGYNADFFNRIRINNRDYYVPNEKFGSRFFPAAMARTTTPFRFPAEKATNSYRIFLLGESAAMGDPDPSYGMGRYLQVLLQERYPGIRFEVICVAVTAIDSNVILPIARDCARRQGNLWVIYMGNNEMVGPFGAETAYGLPAPRLGLIRTILAIKATRLGQLLDDVIQRLRNASATPKTWGGMQMFMNGRIGYDDPARLRAYANFRANLEDILRTAQRAGVPVVLSTVAVNLEDCPPFASVHARGLDTNELSAWTEVFNEGVTNETAGDYKRALACYGKASEIDPQFAELQFRKGDCNLTLTNLAQARHDFEWARDYDALDFRADTRINSAIREAAARHSNDGVYLVDATDTLEEKSADGIPGLNFFYEHVHLNFAANYLLALNFAEKIKGLLPGSITARDQWNWASEELCERRLAVTVWDRQRVWQPIFDRISSPPFTGQYLHAAFFNQCDTKRNQARARMASQTPEQARQIYEQALALAPDDYFLHGNYERFLEAGGNWTQAIVEAKRCCEIVPQLPGGFYYTGTLLVRNDEISEATNYFLRAVAIQGDYAQAETALGEVLANRQKPAEAVRWFERAIRSNPKYVETYVALGFLDEDQGNTAAAMANYQKAADLEPDGPADYFNRANIAAGMYQWDKAIADLEAVVKTKPEFWQAHYLLGIQLAANGKNAEAQREYMEAIHYRPDFAPAHLYLGITLAAQKEFDPALAEFHTVMELDPANNAARQEIESIRSTGIPSDNSNQNHSRLGRSDE
jgi:tetratricopeptide (TPR) repeat protein